MGFFSSSNSHLDDIRKECLGISRKAQEARDRCDASLRGKHEMMDPEQRANLLKQAQAAIKDARKTLDEARQRQVRMDEDNCPSEDVLAAHARVLEASLDVQRAEKAIADGCTSLEQGLGEIEQFFGAGSPEAKQVRRVIAGLKQA